MGSCGGFFVTRWQTISEHQLSTLKVTSSSLAEVHLQPNFNQARLGLVALTKITGVYGGCIVTIDQCNKACQHR